MKEDNWSEHPELKRSIDWKISQIQTLICTAKIDQSTWMIRLNDFPDEPMYSLLINKKPVIHFNDWPDFWNKPK